MKRITIYSDGGCEGNPGPGGWAAVLAYANHRKEISGGEPATTNNRMELQAALGALQTLKESCEIDFFTDSEYLREGITKWIAGWKAKGWKRTRKKTIRNDDLWRALDVDAARHRIQWHWVRGHAGNVENERCDVLAQMEIAKVKQQYSPARLAELLEAFKASRATGQEQPGLFG